MVEFPQFNFLTILCAAVGASVLWAKIGRQNLRPYLFAEIVNLLPVSHKVRRLIEFFIFVIVGTFVGIAISAPINARQAITAGLAWTSVFSLVGEKKQLPSSERSKRQSASKKPKGST